MRILKVVIILFGILTLLIGFRPALDSGVSGLVSVGDLVLSDTLKLDSETGLIQDDRLILIKANCTACHSTKLIQQHRFSREGWLGKIRWMQKNHNLWDLGESEKAVLDYLAQYYSAESSGNKVQPRRMPLKDIHWYKL
jgi:hypothetical protein